MTMHRTDPTIPPKPFACQRGSEWPASRPADDSTLPQAGCGPVIMELPLSQLHACPENDKVYRPIHFDDPEIEELAKSLEKYGIKEPLLVTADYWIISGHRRHAAAQVAGFEKVPCLLQTYRRSEDRDRFMRELVEANRQRVKSLDEIAREASIGVDTEDAYRSMLDYRQATARVDDPKVVSIRGSMRRCRITDAKMPFLEAIKQVLEERRPYWPLSDRAIHYALLNDPPLRHARKPKSAYRNDDKSYRSLIDLVTRARIAGDIPMEAIEDPTRPTMEWCVHDNPASFLQEQLNDFLRGYFRNLQVSQPNHVEIICEKNTIYPILKPVAGRFCIPLTSSRGFASLPAKGGIANRYFRSGKENLILLMVSDFDPEGEEIVQSTARSLRDDFGVEDVVPVKVALTAQQVHEMTLPVGMKAKESSSNYKTFVAEHGITDAYELEAIQPKKLQEILTEAIEGVMDVATFNTEVESERQDARFLEEKRRQMLAVLRQIRD